MQVTRTWDSLSEFIDYASGDTDADVRRGSRERGEGFAGTASFGDATRLAFNWPEGVERIERIKARVQLKSQRTRKVAVQREAGPGVVSMGHFMAGHPQPYTALVDSGKAAKGKGKIVRILLNAAASGGISTGTIEQRGAGLLALVAALEQSGRRVEIVVGLANRPGKNHLMEYRVTVKKAHQKLNLNSVAFAVAHPSMLRRFFFSAMEREDEKTRKAFRVGATYGRVGEFTDVPADAIHMRGARLGDTAWRSDESTARWIAETLQAQGVVVK